MGIAVRLRSRTPFRFYVYCALGAGHTMQIWSGLYSLMNA